jgi:hypothetical protein
VLGLAEDLFERTEQTPDLSPCGVGPWKSVAGRRLATSVSGIRSCDVRNLKSPGEPMKVRAFPVMLTRKWACTSIGAGSGRTPRSELAPRSALQGVLGMHREQIPGAKGGTRLYGPTPQSPFTEATSAGYRIAPHLVKAKSPIRPSRMLRHSPYCERSGPVKRLT